jgi:hypothetical protein
MANGHVAEWLRSGLQNRLPRFNSGRGLQQDQALTAPPLAARPTWHRLGTNRGLGERFYAAERRLRAMGMTVQTPAVQQAGE